MSIALYMDEHIPQDVTDELSKRGVDVITVQKDGLTGESDSEVLDRAAELERVVVTYDRDFMIETSRRLKEDVYFYGVIYPILRTSFWLFRVFLKSCETA